MNEKMVLHWNSRVTDRDEVFVVGDLTLGNYEVAKKYLSRLAGKIYIVPSIGHDRRWVRQWSTHLSKAHHTKKVEILQNIHKVKDGDCTLVLCHYPMLTWENSFHGSIHLHGHEHGNEGIMGWANDSGRADEPGFRVDVGVDVWDFRPITLEEIMQKARRMGFARKKLPSASGGI